MDLTHVKMATKMGKSELPTPDHGSDIEHELSKAINEKAELRKNLNAYAVMAHVAVSDRNAMAERVKGFDHLSNALSEVQEKLKREEERSQDLQLEIWRNEAFVTRSRLQLQIRDNEIQTLREELGKYHRVHEGGEDTNGKDGSGEDSTTLGQLDHTPKDGTSENSVVEGSKNNQGEDAKAALHDPHLGKPRYPMEGGVLIGISREVHEAVVQENLHLRHTMQEFMEKQGASLKDLTDCIQYKEIIKQLKRKISEQAGEMEKINDVLRQAESPKEQTAKMMLNMEAKVTELQRTIQMQQVMIEALSSRSEELSQALEDGQERKEQRTAYMRSSFVDESPPHLMNETQSDPILPSLEIKRLTKENTKFKKLHEHQEAENVALRKELSKAQAERNDAKRKLSALANLSLEPCTTCRDYKSQRERLDKELSITKDDLQHAVMQSETYKGDFHEKCEEMDKLRSVHRSEVDMWKRNFTSLSAQTDQLKRELEQHMKITAELQAQSSYAIQQRERRFHSNPGAGMQAAQYQRCGVSENPWQESKHYASMPSEVAVGRDQCDLPSPQEDNVYGSHQWTTARLPGTRRGRKLRCTTCHREFLPERQREFEEHQTHCRGGS